MGSKKLVFACKAQLLACDKDHGVAIAQPIRMGLTAFGRKILVLKSALVAKFHSYDSCGTVEELVVYKNIHTNLPDMGLLWVYLRCRSARLTRLSVSIRT